jgi:hypothetical protein
MERFEMKKVKCINTIGNFERDKSYMVLENATLYFKIKSDIGEIKTFSKVHSSEYPNFRIYFELSN